MESSSSSSSSSPPQFKNRSEQLSWFIKKRCLPVLNKLAEGIGNNPLTEEMFDKIPQVILIGQLQEINENFGKELDARDLNVIFKICVTYSQSKTVKDMTEKAQKAVELLKENKGLSDKLFSMWNTIKKILN